MALTEQVPGLSGAISVVVSPDGTRVYVAGRTSSAIVEFVRNTGTGALTPDGCSSAPVSSADCTGADVLGLDGVRSLAITHDGAALFAAGQEINAVVGLVPEPTDTPPTAVDDTATVVEDSGPNAVPVLTNDTDPDGGPKLISAVGASAHGAVTITGGGSGLTYAPSANYCNNPPGTTPDTFTYTLNGGSTASVTVRVDCVDDPPTAVDDSATVAQDSAPTSINVLANDTDPDGGPRSIAAATDPGGGAVVITGGGSGLTYRPDPGYCNSQPGGVSDVFGYTLSGGSSANVLVSVNCTPKPPTPGTGLCGTDRALPAVTLVGTARDDLLVGTSGADKIKGLGGDDCLAGRADDDRLVGGPGADSLYGEAGTDRMFGDAGSDQIDGGTGNDRIEGGSGQDRIWGGAGRDVLVGGSGKDTIDGDSGDDRIMAKDGTQDRIRCGTGRDRVIADRVDKVDRDCELVTYR